MLSNKDVEVFVVRCTTRWLCRMKKEGESRHLACSIDRPTPQTAHSAAGTLAAALPAPKDI